MKKQICRSHKKIASLLLGLTIGIEMLSLKGSLEVKAANENPDGYLTGITNNLETVQNSWYMQPDNTFYQTIINNYSSSYGSEANALQISTKEQLAALAKAINDGGKTFEGKFVKLMNDIDLQSSGVTFTNSSSGNFSVTIAKSGTPANLWKPIACSGSFNGTFNGQGYQIKNMIAVNGGLFASCESNATIKNVAITGNQSSCFSVNYTGSVNYRCGVLIGTNSGTITNCYATGNSYSPVGSGGLVGENNGTITNCYATGNSYCCNVGNFNYSGGLAGLNRGTITNCYATGNSYCSDVFIDNNNELILSDASSGGLVGYNVKIITNCFASGNSYSYTSDVYGSYSTSVAHSGGLVGFNKNGTITNCYRNSNSKVFARCSDNSEGNIDSSGTATALSNLKGTVTNTISDFNSNNAWKPITDDYPVLNVFVKNPSQPSNITTTYNSNLKLSDLTIVDNVSGSYGTWAWSNSNTSVGDAGTKTFEARFTASNQRLYNDAKKSITVIVNKADPICNPPVGTAVYGQTLNNIAFTNLPGNTAGTWSWQNSSESVGDVGTKNFLAIFTPVDANNYNTKTGINVSVTVNKADPICNPITGINVVYGQTLNNIALTNLPDNTAGMWAWQNSSESVGDVGTKNFLAIFTPVDTNNYNTKTGINVSVTVNRANPICNPPVGTAAYGQTLSDVILINPSGNTDGTWVWKNPSTSVGSLGRKTFIANFTPTDANNFNLTDNDINVEVIVVKVPKGLKAIYGQTLDDIAITNPFGNTEGTWVWQDPSTSVGDLGTKTFLANFIPTDTSDYNSASINLSVRVVSMDIVSQEQSGIRLLRAVLSNQVINSSPSYQWKKHFYSKSVASDADWQNCSGQGNQDSTYTVDNDGDYNHFVRLKVEYTPAGSETTQTLYSDPVLIKFIKSTLTWHA